MTYIQQKICPKSSQECMAKAKLLDSADYLDIDFDALSQSILLTAFHSSSPKSSGWTQKISKLGRLTKVEVGILAPKIPKQPEELSLGGFLTVLGDDLKASMLTFAPFPIYEPS